MGRSGRTAAAPVLLFYNLDPDWLPTESREILTEVDTLANAFASQGHEVWKRCLATPDMAESLADIDPASCVVFNWCDSLPGVAHSEADVARGLEELGFTYTGSPPEVLALSWQKDEVKRLLVDSGVPTPAWSTLHEVPANGWERFPAIVKPAREHSSLGLGRESVVLSHEELESRVSHILHEFRQPALVEDFIDGREFHVSVWGNGTLKVLPPAEMDFAAFADIRDRLCSYDAKFTPGSRHYEAINIVLPAPLSDDELRALKRVSIAAYKAVGCRDYARIDLRLRDGVFHVLDINPNCDMSSETSTALAASMDLGSFAHLLSEVVALATHRHPQRGELLSGATKARGELAAGQALALPQRQ